MVLCCLAAAVVHECFVFGEANSNRRWRMVVLAEVGDLLENLWYWNTVPCTLVHATQVCNTMHEIRLHGAHMRTCNIKKSLSGSESEGVKSVLKQLEVNVKCQIARVHPSAAPRRRLQLVSAAADTMTSAQSSTKSRFLDSLSDWLTG